MRLLLDENLPHQLRKELPGHDCVTVTYLRWNAIRNGELLQRAAADGFDALLSMDASLPHQHDLSRLPLAIVILRAYTSEIESLRPLIPALLIALEAA